MAGKRPPFKRAMLKLWRQGVRDDTDMRNAMQGLGFDMLDSKHHLRFRTLMSRLRKTDTTYLKGYPPPADIEEILARINVEDALAKVGFSVINNPDFSWIPFYKEFAGNLLDYRDDRESLLRALHEIVSLKDDKYADGSEGPLRDVCPFTTIGTFNRGITNKNRIKIASDIGKFLGVKESAPETFEGIPILNNKNSWLFPFERERGEGDIEAIWHFFAAALDFAESPDDSRKRQAFLKTYDIALKVKHVGQIYLTMGLYWIRPYDYLPLDKNSRRFVKEKFPNIGDVRKRGKDGDGYITLVEELKSEFQREGAPVTSFPQLSHEAYVSPKNPEDTPSPSPTPSPSFESYTWENIVKDGWFGGEKKLKDALKNLQKKKNLILQGPPGTGKTWLAKRLARVFITDQEGEKSKYLLPVQFHPNMSYEDFVMGWRPTGADGGVNLKLADGPMMEMINRAEKDVDAKYFIVIEEINRGNPAQIFGEMLTLMEADKREESEALQLVHQQEGDEKVYIPPNLYIIGTMNLADRSLTMVDYALRRRFAFLNVQPSINGVWFEWMDERSGLSSKFLRSVQESMNELNNTIRKDPNLGENYQIGHSYVTSQSRWEIGKDGPESEWFREIVDMEIAPLLREYWYDELDKFKKAIKKLKIAGIEFESEIKDEGASESGEENENEEENESEEEDE